MADDGAAAAARQTRLIKLFDSYAKGGRTVKSANDSKLWLEAICTRKDAANCVERLVASDNAMKALQISLRFDNSPAFLNGPLKDFMLYIQDPTVQQLCNGVLYKQLLGLLVEPPTLWQAMVRSHLSKQLEQDTELGFASMLVDLLSWTERPPYDAFEEAKDISARQTLLGSEAAEIRALGYRVQSLVKARSANTNHDINGPGGRHDNDHADFRQIAIFPTRDELLSKGKPFLRRGDAIYDTPTEQRAAVHLDNQFRLLREDFLAELRIDLEKLRRGGKGKRPGMRLHGLALAGAYCGKTRASHPFSLRVTFRAGAGQFPSLEPSKRKTFLKDNPKFLKHQALGAILDGEDVIAFATLSRVEELLLLEDPELALQLQGRAVVESVLKALKRTNELDFVLVDTSAFAYEPVLQCLQRQTDLPLSEELLSLTATEDETCIRCPGVVSANLADQIEDAEGQGLDVILDLPKPVDLEASQTTSLLAALRQAVSLIQGPPGTGKSFIGALLAKALHDHSREKILVICYTNHALDQFLEDLLDIGISPESMVRLGSKSTARTKPFSLSELSRNRRTPQMWDIINKLNSDTEIQRGTLDDLMADFTGYVPSKTNVLDYLEFSEDGSEFYDAFQLPETEDGATVVGRRGRAVGPTYLFDQWVNGWQAGVFQNAVQSEHAHIWNMEKDARTRLLASWHGQILQEMVSGIGAVVDNFNDTGHALRAALDQKDTDLLKQRTIIACTTTAAAKYTKHLQVVGPGIVLVEEAGEVLESHVLTALTKATKQLILIGDHQQLRPKVNNYELTVEKGKGYDLNCSLFERLIKAGYPHTTLQEQHRMPPEISALVRKLTYPYLVDAESTSTREPIRGLRSRVVFIDHRQPEVASKIADRRDEGASGSKSNEYESAMVLKIVRYMAQQGYGTDAQVVLTPYLGQLSLLRRDLAQENDPVLNDIDSFDLIRAGVMSASSAASGKRPIRLSTVDNYQGEESDIVIVSLTRSNADGDIGFMRSTERLNVLLSRARKALILIGNSETFVTSRKGAETWRPLIEHFSDTNAIFEGLPVRCEQHQEVESNLCEPTDFDSQCPEGGCSALCGAKLKCGIHECTRKCHRNQDHSKVQCMELLSDECPKKHRLRWRCHALRPARCHTCDEEARVAAERLQRDLDLENRRQALQVAYAERLAKVQREIDHERHTMKVEREVAEQETVLRQRQQDLHDVKAQAVRQTQRMAERKKPTTNAATDTDSVPGPLHADSSAQMNMIHNRSQPHDNTPETTQTVTDDDEGASAPRTSAACDAWHHQKVYEKAQDESMDRLMDMIGLENVKEAFLEIKARIDLATRQGSDVKKDRFGAALLGNPGTGKTTVARLYAKFLSSVGALPGDHFVETTGSKLANDGVQGCRKLLDDILNNGGGALFIDEAYQLTSGSSYGGGAVLDFLLAEVENFTGKVVFIIAGYNKQMEAFFAHNPGIPSRFPSTIQFADYEDTELLEILNYGLTRRYDNSMKVEGGAYGLYARIVTRRLGRGRGKPGFGNARAVENMLSNVLTRQAKRIWKSRRAGALPDDMLLVKEDLIGPKPSDALRGNGSWSKLNAMTGLGSVKDAITALFSSIDFNYRRELEEQPLIDFSLNKVFLGSPGTGKTTVAKLYGHILVDLGLLSNGEVMVKTPADFIGSVMGGSEANTKAILDNAKGKVLVIDEAYGIYGGSGTSDPYRTAVIDTIVAEVQNVPGDDRCVLLLGYKEQMEEMMQNVNPGLRRRFSPDSAFVFEDFNDEQMAVIFDAKLEGIGFKVTPKAREVALEMLQRARNRPNFGNGGEIDNLLNDTKTRQQKRLASEGYAAPSMFEAHDFDEDHARGERATTNVAMLFKDVIGCDGIVSQLQGYQEVAANMKACGMNPRDELPFTFLFRGPPGTGKTTTARKMGKVYYDMGFLAKAEVLDCSAKDLVGEYVGQTGPKTQKLLESALGKVLFIDEAYRLAEGPYAKEAVDELVDCVTKTQFAQKVVVILAGYEHYINRLMDVNPGLSSRFAESVDFRAMTAEESFKLLGSLFKKKPQINSVVLQTPSPAFELSVVSSLRQLCSLANFASARDVQTLAKKLTQRLMRTAKGPASLSEAMVLDEITGLVKERSNRTDSVLLKAHTLPSDTPLPAQQQRPDQARSAPRNIATTQAMDTESVQEPEQNAGAEESDELRNKHNGDSPDDQDGRRLAIRDAGVSDAVWAQLQEDRLREEEEQQEALRLQQEEARLKEWLRKCADAKRQQELAEIERKRKALEEKLKQEALMKKKLAQMGRCPMGYEWIRQASGYRCAGGSHYLSDGDVKSLCG
ncbi:hypothetical protein LTR86_010455 [Recurvomyces mirabilis]|nr:hypothetical protein LTR86_010455 [Recurvomyces mirabilis]